MDYKDMEQLLERYWRCETSPEEEETLRDFFRNEALPEHLARYREWFVYQQLQRQEGLDESFDARVLAQLDAAPVVKAKRLTLRRRLAPLWKAAAAVVILLSLGNVLQHSFPLNEGSVLATDTIGEQTGAPSVAISNDMKAEQALADTLNLERTVQPLTE